MLKGIRCWPSERRRVFHSLDVLEFIHDYRKSQGIPGGKAGGQPEHFQRIVSVEVPVGRHNLVGIGKALPVENEVGAGQQFLYYAGIFVRRADAGADDAVSETRKEALHIHRAHRIYPAHVERFGIELQG